MTKQGRVHRKPKEGSGFTLIELLIVIAIILILIAIALPNFTEAQLRAQLTRVKAELRSLTIALESYNIDFKRYPLDDSEVPSPLHPFGGEDVSGADWYSFLVLTTPHKYMEAVPQDYFQDRNASALAEVPYLTYNYHEQKSLLDPRGTPSAGRILKRYNVDWVVFGIGPDRKWQIETVASDFQIIQALEQGKSGGSFFSYNPTNGSKSLGDIFLTNRNPVFR
ncbi:MAG: prepilin-type N-terminal cleavage/methylation domain-containing protein [Candidatus Omnitrophica bacterium]|nr:hypothetical protein [bacterium]NUN97257.1 prepilin-type N-terminal cleavage/methylation domain-containing protein [Candidatus Omnitrophota bacterium]